MKKNLCYLLEEIKAYVKGILFSLTSEARFGSVHRNRKENDQIQAFSYLILTFY
jgi:hypothetical protein